MPGPRRHRRAAQHELGGRAGTPGGADPVQLAQPRQGSVGGVPGGARDDDGHPTTVTVVEPLDRRGRPVQGGHGHGVGVGPQRRRQGVLVTGLDPQHRRQQAEHADAGPEHLGRRVDRDGGRGEGVAAGEQGGALALGHPLLLLGLALDVGRDRGGGHRPLVGRDSGSSGVLVGVGLVGCPRSVAPQLLQRRRRTRPALLRPGQRPPQAFGLGVGGLHPPAQGGDLAPQPHHGLRPAGPFGGVLPGGPFGELMAPLRPGAAGTGGLQGQVRRGHLLHQVCSLGLGAGERQRQLLKVRARSDDRFCEEPGPLVGEPGDAPQPVVHGACPPQLLRPGVGAGSHPGLLGLGARGRDLRRPQSPGDVGEALGRGAGPVVTAEPLPHGVDVVGEQPQPGVPGVGRDPAGATGGVRLTPEGRELPGDLGGQVGEADEVAVHGGELAQRLLLALAVLEDPRRLLHEGAPLLRGGLQHRIHPALPDHDVQLAADAGVPEQLLHVQQPARPAVDGVLAAPGAEHRARHRDLRGPLPEQTVGVVEGQHHLRAAQGCAGRGAGEDDVGHAPAPQRAGPLLAEHPGDGVDHVGLARAVGPHHARDPRLQTQRRRRGERLEAAQGERGQVHRRQANGAPRSRVLGPARLGEVRPGPGGAVAGRPGTGTSCGWSRPRARRASRTARTVDPPARRRPGSGRSTRTRR